MDGQLYGACVIVTGFASQGERNDGSAFAESEIKPKATNNSSFTPATYLFDWGVVLAEWVKDIQDFGVFHGASLMLDTAGNNEAVSAARIKRYITSGKLKVSLNDIDELVIWMAVSCSNPALLHLMTDQHHVWVEGQYLAQQSGFWSQCRCIFEMDIIDLFCRHFVRHHFVFRGFTAPSSRRQLPGLRR